MRSPNIALSDKKNIQGMRNDGSQTELLNIPHQIMCENRAVQRRLGG
jgi:hypothetical protein